MKSKTKYNYKFISIFKSGINSYNNDDILINTKQTFLVNINDIKKAERTKRNKITLKKYFISIKKHINTDITLKQFRELNKVMYLMNYYNISVSNKTIIKLLNNKIDTKFLSRLRLSACLKSQDSKLYFIILLGYNNGLKYWKSHKSDRFKGELNPAFSHNGRLSALSKNFLKYENMSVNDIKESINNVSLNISKTRKIGLNSSNQINYWLKRGFTEEQAKIEISKRQATNSKDNYIKRYGKIVGLIRWIKRQRNWQKTLQSKPLEEILEINKKKAGSLENQILKYGTEEGTIRYLDMNKRKTKKIIEINLLKYNKDKTDWLIYCSIINKITNSNYKKYYNCVNPNDLKRGNTDYHIDHKVSKYYGFINNIPPYILGSVNNLEMLWYIDNIKKGINNSINIVDLIKDFFNEH